MSRQRGLRWWLVAFVVLAIGIAAVSVALDDDEKDESFEPAVWSINGGSPVGPDDESFVAQVMRVECNSGQTGEVRKPTFAISERRIVVTFGVEPSSQGDVTCEGNAPVAYTVELGEPIGRRDVVDGACLSGPVADTGLCREGAVRVSLGQ